MQTKPTLFIDFDGTICFDYFWRSLPTSDMESVQKFLFGADGNWVQKWMTGFTSAEDVTKANSVSNCDNFERLGGTSYLVKKPEDIQDLLQKFMI